MLEVTNTSALLPVTGPKPIDLDAFVSPAQNLVNGYNIAEQTCFHKTTVGNLIPSLKAISVAYQGLSALVQTSGQLITVAVRLVGDLKSLVTSTLTLLGSVAGLVTTATTLVGTIVTIITTIVGAGATIIGSLGAIRTGATIAGVAAVAAGASCALAFLPFVGYGFLAAGAIATAALLAIVFFLIAILIGTILGSLGAVTTALGTLSTAVGTLAGPLGTVGASVGTVSGTLSNAAVPSDVKRSLDDVDQALSALQNDLTNKLVLFNATAATLDGRAATLQSFLNPTPAGLPVTPRAHLEDTYQQAVNIYDNAITALQALTGSGVWAAMVTDPYNKPQIMPNNTLDKTLACVGTAQG